MALKQLKHRKKLVLLAALLGAGLLLSVAAVSATGGGAQNNKVVICHIPPGNPDNAHTIEVSENAWSAHEDHGDHLGACEGDEDHDENQKITICHIPPGNPENAHSITISVNALDAHLAHGDTTGPCPEEEDFCLGPLQIQARAEAEMNVLSWSAVVDADAYNLYRAEAGGEFELLTTLNTTSYEDSAVDVGTTYQYFVTAVIEGEETDACDLTEITAIPVFGTAFAGLMASAVGIGAYVLSRRRL